MNPKQQPVAADLTDAQIMTIWSVCNQPSEANDYTTGPLPFARALIEALSPPPPHAAASSAEPASRHVRAVEYSNDFAGVKMLRYPTEPAPAGEWVKTELSSATPTPAVAVPATRADAAEAGQPQEAAGQAVGAEASRTYITTGSESAIGVAHRQLGDTERWTEIAALNCDIYPHIQKTTWWPSGTAIKIPAAALTGSLGDGGGRTP